MAKCTFCDNKAQYHSNKEDGIYYCDECMDKEMGVMKMNLDVNSETIRLMESGDPGYLLISDSAGNAYWATHWHKLEDEVPPRTIHDRESICYLTYTLYRGIEVCEYNSEYPKDQRWQTPDGAFREPTHWMYLPGDPK